MKPFLFTLVIIPSLLFTVSHAHVRDLIPFVQVKPDHHGSSSNGPDSTALIDESEPNLTEVTHHWGVHDNQEIIRERINEKIPNLSKIMKRSPLVNRIPSHHKNLFRHLHRCRFNRVRPMKAHRPDEVDPKLVELVFKLTRGPDEVHRKVRPGGSGVHAQILTRRHVGRKFPGADVEEGESAGVSTMPSRMPRQRPRHHRIHGYHRDEFDHDRDHDEDQGVVIKREKKSKQEGGEERETGVLNEIRQFFLGRNNEIRKFLAYF